MYSDVKLVAQLKHTVTSAQRMRFAAERAPFPVLTCLSQAKQNAFKFYFTLAAYFKIRLAKAVDLRKEKILKLWQLLEVLEQHGGNARMRK